MVLLALSHIPDNNYRCQGTNGRCSLDLQMCWGSRIQPQYVIAYSTPILNSQTLVVAHSKQATGEDWVTLSDKADFFEVALSALSCCFWRSKQYL